MLVVLEIILAKVHVFLEFSLGNQIKQPIPDDVGEDVQFLGQIVHGKMNLRLVLIKFIDQY